MEVLDKPYKSIEYPDSSELNLSQGPKLCPPPPPRYSFKKK